MNRKPTFSITIEEELLQEINKRLRNKIADEEQIVSRSSYVSQLIQAGLESESK